MARRAYGGMIYGTSMTVTASDKIAYSEGAALRPVLVPLRQPKNERAVEMARR